MATVGKAALDGFLDSTGVLASLGDLKPSNSRERELLTELSSRRSPSCDSFTFSLPTCSGLTGIPVSTSQIEPSSQPTAATHCCFLCWIKHGSSLADLSGRSGLGSTAQKEVCCAFQKISSSGRVSRLSDTMKSSGAAGIFARRYGYVQADTGLIYDSHWTAEDTFCSAIDHSIMSRIRDVRLGIRYKVFLTSHTYCTKKPMHISQNDPTTSNSGYHNILNCINRQSSNLDLLDLRSIA